MTLREIDRQYEHWTRVPPPSIALARIGVVLGLPAPEDAPARSGPVEPSSLEELRAMGASLGLGGVPPWEARG